MWRYGNARHTTDREAKSPIRISDNDQIENLSQMFARANITSILKQLERHRETLNEEDFKTLLLAFVSVFNNITWPQFNSTQRARIRQKHTASFARQRNMNIHETETHHYRVIFYYILSVIEKYNISNTEAIWTEILAHSSALTSDFYEYVYRNNFTIPTAIRTLFSEKLKLVCLKEGEIFQLQFFRYDVIFPKYIKSTSSIGFLEKLFFRLKLQEKYDMDEFAPEKFIRDMNTPEKLSLFLSFFPNYNIHRIDPETHLNVLEQVLCMKAYFYPQQVVNVNPIRRDVRRRYRSNRPKHDKPNDLNKYRTPRIINLLQQLINRGAQLSQPMLSAVSGMHLADQPFFLTSIGLYVLLSLNVNDLYLKKSSFIRDSRWITFILAYIKRFSGEYQDLIVNYLPLTCAIIQKQKFRSQRRKEEGREDQRINDRFFQQSLSLKQYCRLKIRDRCVQRNMIQLGLSRKLTNYCSYGFSEPDFAAQCIEEVTKYNGKDVPNNAIGLSYDDFLFEGDSDRGRGIHRGGHLGTGAWGHRSEDMGSDSDEND